MKKINRRRGEHNIKVECDFCRKEETYYEIEYSYLNAELRHNGWIPTNYRGEFKDFCSRDCYEMYKNQVRLGKL